MSGDPQVAERLKRIEDNQDTVRDLAVGYFCLGPLIGVALLAAAAIVKAVL